MADIAADTLMELRRLLEIQIARARTAHFGAVRAAWSAAAVEYFWDERQQEWRLQHLKRHRVEAGRHKVLDMAAGCGQFLLAALDAGFDCYGLEPDPWRVSFVSHKIMLSGRPAGWANRMVLGVGEELPFPDASFDYISSFQTLEHVQDPARVVAELLRVTRPGGAIHLMCPDYRSLFEAHYQLPWLPLFPRAAARAYLRALGRPTLGLETIQYTTVPRVRRWVEQAARRAGRKVEIQDENFDRFKVALARRGMPLFPGAFALWRTFEVANGLGRREISVDLLVRTVGTR